jgi:hypothetical protein
LKFIFEVEGGIQKMRKIRKNSETLIAIITALLSACGSTSNTSTTSQVEGYFVDEPVANLKVVDVNTGAEAYTDENGYFRLKANKGNTLKFYIGNLYIGSYKVLANSLVLTPGMVNPSKEKEIISILKSLDNNGNPSDGIQLPQEVMFNVTSVDNISIGSSISCKVGEENKTITISAREADSTTNLIAMAYNIISANAGKNVLQEPLEFDMPDGSKLEIDQAIYYDLSFDPFNKTAKAKGEISGTIKGDNISLNVKCRTDEEGILDFGPNEPILEATFECEINGLYQNQPVNDKIGAIMDLKFDEINFDNKTAVASLYLSASYQGYSFYDGYLGKVYLKGEEINN